MYELVLRGDDVLDGGHKAVMAHSGSALDLLNRHGHDVRRALDQGITGIRELAPRLVDRIANSHVMRLSWDFLAHKGGTSPGPNGRRYCDYTSEEIWGLCKCLALAVRDGTYRPGKEKITLIEKASGQGKRPIVVLNIADRVVQRAIFIVLQPLLDPLLDERSFGYRPKRSHLDALALAEHLTLSERRHVWLAEDIENAFQHVPLGRLLQVIEKLLPASDLIGLLERVLPGQTLPGLRQGGSLSPLCLNVYLNHVLDRPWRRDHADLPLIRVADDLLVLCRNVSQARYARAELERLLTPASMPLKGTEDTTIHDLDAGASAKWLGFRVRKGSKGLAVYIAKRSWRRLGHLLALAHTKCDAPLRAMHIIKQWLIQRGPCYPWTDREQVCQRIHSMAQALAFEEIPGPLELQEGWQRAYARWCKLRP